MYPALEIWRNLNLKVLQRIRKLYFTVPMNRFRQNFCFLQNSAKRHQRYCKDTVNFILRYLKLGYAVKWYFEGWISFNNILTKKPVNNHRRLYRISASCASYPYSTIASLTKRINTLKWFKWDGLILACGLNKHIQHISCLLNSHYY